MRNIIAYLAGGLILGGFALLVVFGGMLDAPSTPAGPAALVGVIAVCVFGLGGWLANYYERRRWYCSR